MRDRLVYRWNKKENDFVIHYPSKPDGHLLHGFFAGHCDAKEFIRELEARGYDLTTLVFSVERRAK